MEGNTLAGPIYGYYERFDTRPNLLLPLKRTYILGSALTAED